MEAKNVLKKIYRMAQLKEEYEKIKVELSEDEWFSDLSEWDADYVMENCSVKDGKFFDSNGVEISDDCRCMDETIPYAVNQSCGYCGDDYYGTMYVNVDDKGTFVAIEYYC